MSRVTFSIFDDLDNPHYGGGGARVTYEVARRLADRHEVVVYTSSYPGSGRRRTRDGVDYRFLPTGWAGPRAGQLLFSLVLPFVLLIRRPDIWFETLTPPFGVSLLPLTAPSVVVGWAQLLPGKVSSERYGIPFWRVERHGLRWYRRLVVLNEADRGRVLEANPGAHVRVIPNGVDIPPELIGSERDAAPFLLFLGRIDVYTKGLDLLLDAHSRARNPLPLVIAGGGSERDEQELRSLVPADGSVRIVGRVDGDEKERLLATCAALVLPSRVETFGLVALEALARGKQVINFDLPTLDWLRPSGSQAVPAFEVDKLAAALEGLPSAAWDVGAIRRAERFARGFEWDIVAAAYSDLVIEVTKAAARSSAPRASVRRRV